MNAAVKFAQLPSTPDALLVQCRAELNEAKLLLAQLLDPKKSVAGEEKLNLYNGLLIGLTNSANRSSLFSSVHPDPKMRDAADIATQEVSAFSTDLSLNGELYAAMSAVEPGGLDEVTQRWLSHTLRDFRRAGVDRSEVIRTRLKVLADQLVKLGQTFDRNIREDVRSVQLRPEQLKGLPNDYIASHPPGADGRVTITTDYPDLIPFRTYAEDGDARMSLHIENLSRAFPINEQVYRDLLAARQEQATLLGYRHWADYVTEDKMIGSGQNIRDFVAKVADGALHRARADYQALLARKRQDSPGAETVNGAEALYYEEKVRQGKFAFESQSVRPYFDFARTQQGLLDITARLFGIRYVRATDALVWHEDVQVFDVFRDDAPLGRIYLDLHPRPDKYKHAAQFSLVNGVKGTQLPEGALVCNFPNPRISKPALLEHGDVVTLFHEFGHLMHHVLGGEVRWVSQSGVATEWDFVEAPSQMFEEWAWDLASLRLFARHVETNEPIPEELLRKMRAANEFGKGTWARTQAFYAELSRRYHSEDPSTLDLQRTLVEAQAEYSLFAYIPGTHLHTSFGHLNGYSAVYYTYLWSLVIAKDLFSEFQSKGLLDESTSRRYRDTILAPGGTKDAAELVHSFLGRPYKFDAFEQWLNQA